MESQVLRKRRLRLKMHQLVIQEMEEAKSRPEPTNSAPRPLLPSQCENTY
jgi:hypothetical protein